MGTAVFVPNYTEPGSNLPSTGVPHHAQIADSSDSTYVHVGKGQSSTDTYRIDVFQPALTISSVVIKIRIKNSCSTGASNVGTIKLLGRMRNLDERPTLSSNTISTPDDNINELSYTMTKCPLTNAAWRPEDLLNIEQIRLTLTNPGDYHTWVYRVWLEVNYDDSSLCSYDVLVPVANYSGGSGTDYKKVDDAMWGRDGATLEGKGLSYQFTITSFQRKCTIQRVSAVWNIYSTGSISAPSATDLKLWQNGTEYKGATYFSGGNYNELLSYRHFDTNPYTGMAWKPADLLNTRIGVYLHYTKNGQYCSDVMYVIVYYRPRRRILNSCVV